VSFPSKIRSIKELWNLSQEKSLISRLVFVARSTFKRYSELKKDKAIGIETAHLGPQDNSLLDLNPNRSLLVGYNPTDWSLACELLNKISVSNNDVFIDYGSGKGRVLMVAAKFPFRRLIGIELNSDLHKIACDNIAKFADIDYSKIELLNIDATQFHLPEDVSVIFMNNPFKGSVFDRVLSDINLSLAKNPRRITFIYVNPVMHAILIENGFELQIDRQDGQKPHWSIYTKSHY
jgi:precorrin-6B methylase 2